MAAVDLTSNRAVYDAASATALGTTTKATKTSLGQSDFIALMTAQLKNQDPFNPLDNTQMVAQMAQFSSVAGISEMNTTLSSLATKMNSVSASDAMGFVGRNVLTEGAHALERSAGGIAGAVELGAAATDVSVTISDAAGQPVRTLQLGASSAGTVSYDWDGKDDAGNKAAAGPYQVTVEAANGPVIVAATSLVWAPVQSASLPPGGAPTLNVAGLGEISPSAVRKVA